MTSTEAAWVENGGWSRIGLAIVIIVGLAATASASDSEAERFMGIEVARLQRIIELSYSLSENAIAEVEALQQDYPASPVPHFIRASQLYWLQSFKELDEAASQAYEESAKEALDLARDYAKERQKDLDARFVAGMIELNLARFYVEKARWIEGFFKARSGLRNMRRILKENPDYHDAKLPVGMANCFLAEAPAYLKPFALLLRFSADMEEGLAQLEDCWQHGLFTRYEGLYALVGVNWELVGDREKARGYLQELVQRFPSNVAYQQLLAKMDIRAGRKGEARSRLMRVLGTPAVEEFPVIEMEAMIWLGRLLLGEGEAALSLNYSQALLAMLEQHPELEEFRPWITLLHGQSLYDLRRYEEAKDRFLAIGREDKRAHEAAQAMLAKVNERLEATVDV